LKRGRDSGERRHARRPGDPTEGRGADHARTRLVAKIILADNMAVLPSIPSGSVNLIYTDPPFNTGAARERTTLRTVRDDAGDRTGFQGRRYRSTAVGSSSYADAFDDFLSFLEPRLIQAHRILASDGSLFLHLDFREVHYAKVLLDGIFGRESFMNEIIWAYDYGGRPKRRWPAKHDTILWYAKDPSDYTFNYEEIDRIPYMAPGLVTPEKAARGKTPTDVWWHTIVSPTGKEKTGYPTQKPLGIVERIVRVHSDPGDLTLDMFAGSGTLGEAAARNGRCFILIDENPEAAAIMAERLAFAEPACVGFEPAGAASGSATDANRQP
jgi:site-specific DNA-methyltransferase (adenine-specific)